MNNFILWKVTHAQYSVGKGSPWPCSYLITIIFHIIYFTLYFTFTFYMVGNNGFSGLMCGHEALEENSDCFFNWYFISETETENYMQQVYFEISCETEKKENWIASCPTKFEQCEEDELSEALIVWMKYIGWKDNAIICLNVGIEVIYDKLCPVAEANTIHQLFKTERFNGYGYIPQAIEDYKEILLIGIWEGF